MIFSADDIPALQKRAATVCRAEFEALKKSVDALPDIPDDSWAEEHIIRQPDGSIKPVKASTRAYWMLKVDGASQANKAALVYLVTGEKKDARIAQTYLLHSLKILKLSEQYGRWADWQGNFRINQILAYDWICNELTLAERRAILLPILEYLQKSRKGGKFTFRRSPASALSRW